MPTLNKLEYLDETKAEIKTALNQFGSGITDEDTFRSYVDKIKAIYNNWQKVTGTGTDITLNNTKLAKMILELGGNTSQDGEPTPDTPVEVEVVTGENTVVVQNRNVWNEEWEVGSYNSSGEAQSSSNTIRNKYPIKVKPNTNYYFYKGFDNSGRICWYDESMNFISTSTSAWGTTKTSPANAYFVNISTAITYGNSYRNDICVNQSDNLNGTYTAHAEQDYIINLGSLELANISTYKDFIFHNIPSNPYYDSTLINGAWYKRAYLLKYVVTSSSTFGTTELDTVYRFRKQNVTGIGASTATNSKCNILDTVIASYSDSTQSYYSDGVNEWLVFKINKEILNTYPGETIIAKLQAYVADKGNIIFWLPLATPTNTPITDTTLINQLNAIEEAMSYDEQTNISQTNADLPFIITSAALMKGGN